MSTFFLNGAQVSGADDHRLLPFLRDVCGIKSVKNGCDMGICGACTVIIDGIKKTSCHQTLAQVAGKHVVTIEGMSQREREVYAYAFGKAGAVQCGFCIPGMVLSAKALLDKTPHPTSEQIRQGIRGNLCRCTGYVKITQAIQLAAQLLSDKTPVPLENGPGGVGERLIRLDSYDKALGRACYCDDLQRQGMLYGAVKRTDYPRARILSIDTQDAKALPGVQCVLTATDVPGSVYDGYISQDWPVMVPVGDITRYIGDALAIVAADTVEIARKAATLIKVEYDVQDPLTSPQQALAPDAPALHPDGNILTEVHVSRGDVAKAMADSALVIREEFQTPATEHAFMEPESALSYFDESGILTVHVGTQNIHHDAHCLSHILGIPQDQIHVCAETIGGAFGGKEDLTVQHHAALLTYYTKRPVKLTFTREESIRVHPKRHPMHFTMELGVDSTGHFTALRGAVTSDTGAYASLGAGVTRRAVSHLCGPYRIPNTELSGQAVYTNNPPSGAFRGFGAAQAAFAIETMVDIAAQKLGVDRFEIRRRNVLHPGDRMGTGQICTPDTAIAETLDAVKIFYDKAIDAKKTIGIACAIKNAGVGMGLADIGRASLRVENGRVVLYTAALCIGQGLVTAMVQIAAQTLGISAHEISTVQPNTAYTLDTGATTGSRQTVISGEAVRQAALHLKEALQHHTLSELEGKEFAGEYMPHTDPLNSVSDSPRFHVAYGYATNLVILGNDGRIERIIAAHDVGRAINPLNVEGQLEGGIVMGMGYALTENFLVENGYIKSTFAKLGLLRSTDIPPIETIIIGKSQESESYGAKGVGEIATIPIAPAIASAYNARANAFQHSLPLKGTPYSR